MKQLKTLRNEVREVWDLVLFAALTGALSGAFTLLYIYILVRLAVNG